MSQPRPHGWMGMCEQCYGWAWHVSSVPLWAEKGHESKNPPGGPGEPGTSRHQAQGKKTMHTPWYSHWSRWVFQFKRPYSCMDIPLDITVVIT